MNIPYGWFNLDGDEESAPWPSACPYCGAEMDETDVRTHSFMPEDCPEKSYYFRTHKSCDLAASKKDQDNLWHEFVDLTLRT